MPSLWKKCKQSANCFVVQLLIPSNLWEKILSHAKEQSPKECCGYLLGEVKGKSNILLEVFPMQNIHPSPTRHFSFSPQEQLRVLKEFSHLQIIGIYHSHPLSPPTPSQEDKAYMFFETYSNLIISLQNGISFASYRKIQDKTLAESVLFPNAL